MTPKSPPPSVFQFLDAREFLQKAYDERKRATPAFSHRYIARSMAARSSSFFKDVLSGRIQLSQPRARAFARLFGLGKAETDYFENLVLYTQALTESEKKDCLAKMTESGGRGSHTLLAAFQMEYFKKWHYAAVRELLAFHEFDGDYAELGEMLRPSITPAEAMDAVRLLLKLKLIRKTAQGGLALADRVVSSGADDPALVRPALLENLALAREAIDLYPPERRPFSYLTLSVSEASLQRIRDKARRFRREILEIATTDNAVDRVYQMNLQIFPLSGTVKRRKK